MFFSSTRALVCKMRYIIMMTVMHICIKIQKSSIFFTASLRNEVGAPLSRNRLYILLLRSELLTTTAKRDLGACAEGLVATMKQQNQWDWKLGIKQNLDP